ncbi:hypothetical protein [Saccharomonospora viridis]|uniref:Uncharacterized protein n=1 Tax=Saccharomonospora viridis (strain ATCC 15386 / DSM 43017 / JCM 3036 / CCUG 5913 / NBRC 12207 / NCIMB 9602 / P101) TaxID=471857 RepID=C7MRT9_SACVD|nr:hypothetical protein [Saccharomonospora viridis]ACU95151.1 hypothetical protein Svir_00620 [Saccharomonospora viridis DSM 43017]
MSPRSASDRMMRGIRGVLLAGCSATLSVAAHALGGGPLPHLLPTLALTVLIGWVSTALAEQTRGLGGVLIVLGSAQLVSHLLLGELSGHTVNSPAMLTCHGVATFATAFVLARAEAMLAMAAAVLSLLRGLFVVCVASPGRMEQRGGHPVVRTAEGLSAVAVLLRRAHPRRGPPSTLLTSSERHPASV